MIKGMVDMSKRKTIGSLRKSEESTNKCPRFTIEIVEDDSPDNPRDWDNLGTMVCWHSNYRLGDANDFSEPSDFMRELVDRCVSTDELINYIMEGKANGLKFEKGEDENALVLMSYSEFTKNWYEEVDFCPPCGDKDWYLREFILNNMSIGDLSKFANKNNLILPLYLIDHSGISISTSDFNDHWDSGQVGWVYVSYKDIEKEYGEVTTENIENARSRINAEVKLYDCYLKGECYGFQLYEYGSEIDSCYGFLGGFEEVKEEIKGHVGTECAVAIDSIDYFDEEWVAEFDERECA